MFLPAISKSASISLECGVSSLGRANRRITEFPPNKTIEGISPPMKWPLLRIMAVALLTSAQVYAAPKLTDDYLALVDDPSEVDGILGDYRRLWERKLLVTRGDIARFVHLPGLSGEESAVSVYRDARRRDGLPGSFWVTSTMASARLWSCMPQGGRRATDPRTVGVSRRDAPLPDSTARLVNSVWIAMLSGARPPPAGEIQIDSDGLIFSAATSRGRITEANARNFDRNSLALMRIGIDLFSYANMPASMRPGMARKIEKAASGLLKRISH